VTQAILDDAGDCVLRRQTHKVGQGEQGFRAHDQGQVELELGVRTEPPSMNTASDCTTWPPNRCLHTGPARAVPRPRRRHPNMP
jgi:hypothetical protein